MSLNSALKSEGGARRRGISKQLKRIQTSYAEEFGEKQIPFEKEELPKEPDTETLDDLEWFLGNSQPSSSSQKWQRLHHGRSTVTTGSKAIGQKPVQSLLPVEEVDTDGDLATGGIGASARISLAQEPPSARISQPKLNLKRLLQQDVTPAETAHAEPLKPIHASTFAPMISRPTKAATSKPNHYQFFATICPSENVDRRKFLEQKQLSTAKTGMITSSSTSS
eukprot:gnl/MRDRNA2_/MRDRNA2_82651_c0_seq1.p1 gnl/MRDRNA2_/MRDRNA2_82651_c0~~gnl/MRDRNA2_/MRDRNA2_82651_c0_seq1.p1  ORF type:complete len:223 (-),score=48.27 gnl/MRDRNA2_/MRDRNA2_82651_c0_seq1:229-897(-)